MRNFFSALLSILFVLATGSAAFAEKSEKKIKTSWETNGHGTMKLTVDTSGEFTGSYEKYSGKLSGAVAENGTIHATWYQPQSKTMCNEERFDTQYWGRVEWEVVDKEKLKGKWYYCDESQSQGSWNGKQPTVGAMVGSFLGGVVRVAGGVAGAAIGGVGGQLASLVAGRVLCAAASSPSSAKSYGEEALSRAEVMNAFSSATSYQPAVSACNSSLNRNKRRRAVAMTGAC